MIVIHVSIIMVEESHKDMNTIVLRMLLFKNLKPFLTKLWKLRDERGARVGIVDGDQVESGLESSAAISKPIIMVILVVWPIPTEHANRLEYGKFL